VRGSRSIGWVGQVGVPIHGHGTCLCWRLDHAPAVRQSVCLQVLISGRLTAGAKPLLDWLVIELAVVAIIRLKFKIYSLIRLVLKELAMVSREACWAGPLAEQVLVPYLANEMLYRKSPKTSSVVHTGLQLGVVGLNPPKVFRVHRSTKTFDSG
jgi:hypothetical protein